MLTTDFIGTYDYEKEEAEAEFCRFLKHLDEDTLEQSFDKVARLFTYWRRVLTEPGSFEDFCKHWNGCCSRHNLPLGLYMIP